jgi:YebC/PmpR family DNA-binding regulatory protein
VAGHSKWANIQHRKGAQDAKRNKLFSKLSKEITVSAKVGGADTDANPRLRSAIATAKKNSMPAKNIENAIKRGTGEIEGADLVEITYEGYGPNAVAIFVEASTDNKNRTVSDVRSAFTKGGGQLGENGVVDWMFDRMGLITVKKEYFEVEDDLMELVIEAGGEDLKSEGELWHIYTAFEDLFAVREELEKLSVHVEEAELTRVPKTVSEIETVDDAVKILRLIQRLEDADDVMKVYSNFDCSDEIMEQAAEKL